jgi:DNA-directed RNA polymerase omega subunit
VSYPTPLIIPDQLVVPAADNGGLTSVESIYRLIIVAGLRTKQLQRGSQPRIEPDPLKRKNTSIALEEIRQGRVVFHLSEGKE